MTSPATPFSTRSLSRQSDKHSQLAGLYAARNEDGMDTFGNTGLLRCVIPSLWSIDDSCVMQVWSYRSWAYRCCEDREQQRVSDRTTHHSLLTMSTAILAYVSLLDIVLPIADVACICMLRCLYARSRCSLNGFFISSSRDGHRRWWRRM